MPNLVDPPAIITQLATQFAACAAWTGGLATIWYPEAPALAGATFPLLVLGEARRRVVPFCDGATTLVQGELEAVLESLDDIGKTEDLARTLLTQLLGQTTGILFRPSECGLSSDPTPAKISGGSPYRSVLITLGYGLSA